MKELEVKNGQAIGWYCRLCGGYCDILSNYCVYNCNVLRPKSLAVISFTTRALRDGTLHEIGKLKMSETERELHIDFFTQWSNEERLLITDMSDEQLTEHRNELAKIALEGKVRTSVADEELRQRRAVKVTAGKPWLLGSENVTEIRAGIKTRTERLSKEDKIVQMMQNIGVEVPPGFIKKVTDEKIKSFKLVKKVDTAIEEPKDDTPFDFSKLGD